jgi:hypothetical protein
MTLALKLKRVQPNYFYVIHDREIVGRIYRLIGAEELWRWTAPGPHEPTDGPSGGICASLDQTHGNTSTRRTVRYGRR